MSNLRPAPMVPADCDLRGMAFMPMDTVRLIDSDFAALSTGEEFKAAVMLWCKAWQQLPGGSLPDDDRVLAHLSGAGARWKKVKAMALHGFVLCSDGRLYHPVIAEKALDAWKHRQSQRERAARRWHGPRDMPRHTQGNATADATASPTAMQGTVTGTVNNSPCSESNTSDQGMRTNAGAVCARLKREAGMVQVNPSDTRLQAALDLGVTPDALVATAKDFPGKPLAYVISAAVGRHRDAARLAAGEPHGTSGTGAVVRHLSVVDRIDRAAAAAGIDLGEPGAGGRVFDA